MHYDVINSTLCEPTTCGYEDECRPTTTPQHHTKHSSRPRPIYACKLTHTHTHTVLRRVLDSSYKCHYRIWQPLLIDGVQPVVFSDSHMLVVEDLLSSENDSLAHWLDKTAVNTYKERQRYFLS